MRSPGNPFSSSSPSLSLSLFTQALKSTRTEALPGLTYVHQELQGHTHSLRCCSMYVLILFFANLVGSLSDSNLGQSLSSSQFFFFVVVVVETVFLCVVLDVLKFAV